MKILIDECLSPTLATMARECGFPPSTHVTWLGLRSRQDWALVRRAIDDLYILVTHDSTDFTALMEREPRHPGLVCMNVHSPHSRQSAPQRRGGSGLRPPPQGPEYEDQGKVLSTCLPASFPADRVNHKHNTLGIPFDSLR